MRDPPMARGLDRRRPRRVALQMRSTGRQSVATAGRCGERGGAPAGVLLLEGGDCHALVDLVDDAWLLIIQICPCSAANLPAASIVGLTLSTAPPHGISAPECSWRRGRPRTSPGARCHRRCRGVAAARPRWPSPLHRATPAGRMPSVPVVGPGAIGFTPDAVGSPPSFQSRLRPLGGMGRFRRWERSGTARRAGRARRRR